MRSKISVLNFVFFSRGPHGRNIFRKLQIGVRIDLCPACLRHVPNGHSQARTRKNTGSVPAMPRASRCAGCNEAGGPFPRPYTEGAPPRDTRCVGCDRHGALWVPCQFAGCACADAPTRCVLARPHPKAPAARACSDCEFAARVTTPSKRAGIPGVARSVEGRADTQRRLAAAHQTTDLAERADVWLRPRSTRCGYHVARAVLWRRFGLIALIAPRGEDPPGDAPVIAMTRGPASVGAGRVQRVPLTLSRMGGAGKGLKWVNFSADPGAAAWGGVRLVAACADVAARVKAAKGEGRGDLVQPHAEKTGRAGRDLGEAAFRRSLHLSTSSAFT